MTEKTLNYNCYFQVVIYTQNLTLIDTIRGEQVSWKSMITCSSKFLYTLSTWRRTDRPEKTDNEIDLYKFWDKCGKE